MKTKTPYNDLALVPWIIAETIADEPYEGQECSPGVLGERIVKAREVKRSQMTPEQKIEFAAYCDTRCKDAYEHDAEWFMLCIRDEDLGRDRLWNFIRHWLASYLDNGMKQLLERYETDMANFRRQNESNK